MSKIPSKGDTFTFQHGKGYVLSQNRPFACRYKCVCGKCNGEWWTTEETITQVIYWGDGAIEVIGDGGSRQEVRPCNLD